MSKDILPFRSRLARRISPSLEAGRTQLGQAEGAKRQLTSTLKKKKKAGLESQRCLVTRALNFVHSGRRGGVQVMTRLHCSQLPELLSDAS